MTFCSTTTGFPTKWSLRKQRRNFLLIKCNYPHFSDWLCHEENLLQPIRSGTQISVVTLNQYDISVLFPQTLFCRETGSGVTGEVAAVHNIIRVSAIVRCLRDESCLCSLGIHLWRVWETLEGFVICNKTFHLKILAFKATSDA